MAFKNAVMHVLEIQKHLLYLTFFAEVFATFWEAILSHYPREVFISIDLLTLEKYYIPLCAAKQYKWDF